MYGVSGPTAGVSGPTARVSGQGVTDMNLESSEQFINQISQVSAQLTTVVVLMLGFIPSSMYCIIFFS